MKIKFNKTLIYLSLLSLVAGFFYSHDLFFIYLKYLDFFPQIIFNWPDANANYFFVKLFTQTNTLSFYEPLNIITDNIIHTRSINVLSGSLVPMSWLWPIILWASLAKIFGLFSILWLNPILAMLSLWLVYAISQNLFKDKNLSFLITALLAFFAPWLYFANLVMLPSILIIFLYLLSAYLFLKSFSVARGKLIIFSIASAIFVLSVLARPSEFIWLASILLLSIYFNKNKIQIKHYFTFIIIFLIFTSITLYFNNLVYGNYFSFGYLNFQATSSAIPAQSIFLPFGWQTKIFLKNIFYHFILLIWPYWILVLTALIILRKKVFALENIWKKYLLICVVASFLLFIYYANWDIADMSVKQYNKISNSYVRYFLPLYILWLPIFAKSIQIIFNSPRVVAGKYFYQTIIIVLLSIFSLHLAFYAPFDGLLAQKKNIKIYYQQFEQVKNLVPADAIILTIKSDKIFFPSYPVIVPQGDLPLWPRLAKLLTQRPVFYVHDLAETDLFKEKAVASQADIEFNFVSELANNFKLEELKLIK